MSYYILLSLFLGTILILKQVNNHQLQEFLAKIRMPVIISIILLLVWSIYLVFSCPMEWLEIYVLNTFFDVILLISLFVAYNHSWEYWQNMHRIVHTCCTCLGTTKVLLTFVYGGMIFLIYFSS